MIMIRLQQMIGKTMKTKSIVLFVNAHSPKRRWFLSHGINITAEDVETRSVQPVGKIKCKLAKMIPKNTTYVIDAFLKLLIQILMLKILTLLV